MRSPFKRNAARREFRAASAVLIAVFFFGVLIPAVIKLSASIAMLAFMLAAASYTALAILTYYRLRDASISGWWLLSMVIVLHVGPQWQLGSWSWGSASFTPSGLVAFAPVIIGWFAAAKSANPLSHDSIQAG
jgi:uncharacterized membrane protein YhaH (DUF805 family)